ncbi:GntR family transcriptional regulator [Paenarthrobacter sp. YJN-5]|uniref:GntR family transcriptional regulator n=1 Tax=Paenarthrobacter sp. YJN-5 TaxID=2735316 RepID=UPI001877B94D|nr:GntR family transcriptional regulator [Paenarthrobacter sp. YJN-5]QOT19829.1 GntR family transcriptional regulator [Paenarthrobacter sp. YJN-5]
MPKLMSQSLPLGSTYVLESAGGETASGRTQQDLPGDEIYQRIRDSVLRNRIAPGTKLAEVKLCELFGTNRETVRRALIRLASDGLVDYFPKRGAFVASPSEAQVEQVRDARVAIESDISGRIAGRVDQSVLQELSRIATEQIELRQAGDLDAAVALSGSFHVTLAQASGNAFCVKYLVELTALTSLALAKFAVPPESACPIEEHVDITAALRAPDGVQAANLMRAHLERVHNAILQSARRPAPSVDLGSLMRP